MRITKTITVLAAGLIVLGLVFPRTDGLSDAERLAIRIDRVLDGMEEPRIHTSDLLTFWPAEIAPYFDYEGLSDDINPPSVRFFTPTDGAEHNHLSGYTYCDEEVFLNRRYVNPVSHRFESINSLSTLVHEMIHTLGGDFCSPMDSETTESTTETATTEVLAALANHGNDVALYVALENLKEIAIDTAWYEALRDNDMAGFYRFITQVYDDREQARLAKAVRYWSKDMDYLKTILFKYSVKVFDNFQAGKVDMNLPEGFYGMKKGTLVLDDVRYLMENFEDMVGEDG